MSYVDRGIDREAEPKQGPIATAMERRGKTSLAGSDRRACRARNARRAALRKTVREPECNLQRLSAGPGSAENIADAATVFSITSAEVGHWQRWREQVLSKRYAADLRGSALARFWRIEFSHDALIFSNSRGRFIDEGWRISTKQGNAIELRGMLDAAAAHGWQELVVSGDYHFKRRAMAMALNRGFAVVAEGADLELLREMQARGNHGKAAARHRPQEEKFETDFFSAHQRQGERSRGIGR